MISKNIGETAKIAKLFLNKILKNGTHRSGALVVALSGNLGAGKTAFTQTVAKHLGIRNKIISPTFVIMKRYRLPLRRESASTKVRTRGFNFEFFFHIDAYRLKNEKELLHLGWDEIIKDKNHLVFIEWPENVAKVIPRKARYVHIEHGKNDHRKFKLK